MLAINGSFERDKVTREKLQEAAELQATAWLAERQAREINQEIEQRIRFGAEVEDCEYYFDRELQMVRSKGKKESAG